jgi:hypothetical protein
MNDEFTMGRLPRSARPCLLLALLLCGVAPYSSAQPPNPDCLSTGSRARAACEPTKTVIATETEVKFTVEVPPVKSAQCAATIEIEYTQRDSLVGVEGTIHHLDCGASNGEHRLTVSVRDENRELKTLAFVEAWQRKDDQPVKFSVEYQIGDNVDLVSVRTRQLRCTCGELPEEPQ